MKVDVGLVRGVLAERVVISTTLNPFLPLKALAAYCGLSVRKLRGHLADLNHALSRQLDCLPRNLTRRV